MPISFPVNYERTNLFSVKRDLDSPRPPPATPPLFTTLSLIGRLPSNGPGNRNGLMVSALISVSSGPGPSAGRGHCGVFMDKTLYSRIASLHPGV